ncbi:hypothetical protein K1X76_12445 [bacterium]|nr:hypothetical protein [bacterium]
MTEEQILQQMQGMDPDAIGGAAMAGFMIVYVGIMALLYVYFSLCLMKIAQKTNTPNAWMAWIPIVNIVLILQIAKQPMWWIILLLIPFVNIVMSIIVWMKIAEARGKPGWVGVLLIVPVAGLFVPGYLAFTD